jgi:hypothetical protein
MWSEKSMPLPSLARSQNKNNNTAQEARNQEEIQFQEERT